MTENYTKWYITACFKTEDGSELKETKAFWSKVAKNEEDAIERYSPPESGMEMIEVYRVTKDSGAKQEEINVEDVSEESETTEDVGKDIIHA